MKVDRKEAKELIEEYFQTYPRVKEYMEESIRIAQEKESHNGNPGTSHSTR